MLWCNHPILAGTSEKGLLDAGSIAGRVFAKFDSESSAVACASELHGKVIQGHRSFPSFAPLAHSPFCGQMFVGRTVTAAFLPAAKLDALAKMDCYTLQ